MKISPEPASPRILPGYDALNDLMNNIEPKAITSGRKTATGTAGPTSPRISR